MPGSGRFAAEGGRPCESRPGNRTKTVKVIAVPETIGNPTNPSLPMVRPPRWHLGYRDHQGRHAVDREIHMVDRTRSLIEAFSVIENKCDKCGRAARIVIRQERRSRLRPSTGILCLSWLMARQSCWPVSQRLVIVA